MNFQLIKSLKIIADISHKVTKMKIGIKSFLITIIIGLGLLFNIPANSQTASLILNGVQQYFDNNGNPLTSGKVYYYEVGTTVFKPTWQNSAMTTPNTNPVTLNAAGRAIIYGNGLYRQIVKDQAGNLIWDAVTSPAGGGGGGSTLVGDGNLVGTIHAWAGLIAPNQYVFAYGQEISRLNFPDFFTAITQLVNVNCASGSNTLTGITDTSQININSSIELICVPVGTTVISKTSSTIVVSNPANVSLNAIARFFPFGSGNNTTTFNVPDLRGYAIAGRDNMGPLAANRLTSAFFNNPGQGAVGGSQSKVLVGANLPPYTPTGTVNITDPGHIHNIFSNGHTASIMDVSVGGPIGYTGSTNSFTNISAVQSSTTGLTSANVLFVGNAQGGTSSGFGVVQPTITLNYIIKITPDIPASSVSGVSSLGGMSGIIACGSGLVCTGNVIDSLGGGLIPNNTTMGNVSGSSAVAIPLSATQLTTLCNVFTTSLSGCVSGSGGGTVNFLRADGTWSNPLGLGTAGYAIIGNGASVSTYQGFVPTGTGAITRTWNAKIADYVNARDFGTIGNGVADDTTALQNALNAAAVSTNRGLYIPTGRYKITTALAISSHVNIVGDGHGGTGSRCYLGNGCTNFILSDLINGTYILPSSTIDGIKIQTNDAVNISDLGIVYLTNPTALSALNAIKLQPATGATNVNFGSNFHDILIAAADRGISIFDAVGWRITGSQIYNPISFGVYISNINSAVLGDFDFEGNFIIGGNDVAGQTNIGGLYINTGCGRIRGNKFDTLSTTRSTKGIWINPTPANTSIEPCVITNNTLEGINIPIFLDGSGVPSTSVMGQFVINSNQMWPNIPAGNCILSTAMASGTGRWIAGGTINGNFCTVAVGSGAPVGFVIDGMNDVVINANQFGIFGAGTGAAYSIGSHTATLWLCNNMAIVGISIPTGTGFVCNDLVDSNIVAGSAIATTTSTSTNVTTISLIAGDWDVWGQICNVPASAPIITDFEGWINTVSATPPSTPNNGAYVKLNFSLTGSNCMPIGRKRYNLAATTTLYLTAFLVFTGGTEGTYGYIGASRVR